MKNLKVMMITLMMCLVTMVSCKQKNYSYKNDLFTTKQTNGAMVEKDITFSLEQKYYESIKNSKLFVNWEKETFSDPANKEYINKHKDWDRVILYLNSKIVMSLIYLKMNLNNANSLEFIDGSKGFIGITDKGEILISYNFKAQNGFGNFITSECIYSVSFKDGKEESFCSIN